MKNNRNMTSVLVTALHNQPVACACDVSYLFITDMYVYLLLLLLLWQRCWQLLLVFLWLWLLKLSYC